MKLTPEVESWIDGELSEKGRYPRNDTLAKRLGCLVPEADSMLAEYRLKHGDRVRNKVETGKQLTLEPEVEKVEKVVTLGFWKTVAKVAPMVADWMVDTGTILTAVIIDLVLSGVCLWIMGPSSLEKVAFVAIAFVIVLFGLRALIKGYFLIYIACVSVAWFLDTSFVMVGIDYQTNLTVDDRELVKLEGAEKDAHDYLEALKAKQIEKGEGFKSQVDAQQRVFDDVSEKASVYRRQIANKPREAPQIRAYDIFYAIPKAMLSGTVAVWIALVLFGTVFAILQATMYTTIIPKKVKKERE
jgi:hypothetical protein